MSVLVEIPDVIPLPIDPVTCKSIGIDLGISSFLVDTNGNKTDSPKFLKNKLEQLKRRQRLLARKQKASRNREKARIKLAKLHRKIRNSRADWLHQLSNQLTRDYDLICAEDLKTKSLLTRKSNKSLNRSISDQGWGTFLGMLKYNSARKDLYPDQSIRTQQQDLRSLRTCSG